MSKARVIASEPTHLFPPHEPHEDELDLYTEWVYCTAKMFLTHALCMRRRGVPDFSAPEEARSSLGMVQSSVFSELLQWVPHRTVRIEKGNSFYSDETKTKILSIAKLKGVGANAIHTMRHGRLETLGWQLHEAQFRGVADKVSGGTMFTITFQMRYLPTNNVRHHAVLTYTVSEVGRNSMLGSNTGGLGESPSLVGSTSGMHIAAEGNAMPTYAETIAKQNHRAASSAQAKPKKTRDRAKSGIRKQQSSACPDTVYLQSPLAFRKEWW